MKEYKLLFSVLSFAVVSFALINVSEAARVWRCAPAPAPVAQGGIAFAVPYRGGPFSWERWIKPIIHITQNGSSTSVTVENGNNTPVGNLAEATKFNFTKDQYIWTNMNSINPDLSELVKVLVAEKFLPEGTTKTVYDNDVKNAVDKFQHAHNIHPSENHPYGYFGPITRKFLNNNSNIG